MQSNDSGVAWGHKQRKEQVPGLQRPQRLQALERHCNERRVLINLKPLNHKETNDRTSHYDLPRYRPASGYTVRRDTALTPQSPVRDLCIIIEWCQCTLTAALFTMVFSVHQ
ncbi:hypothetical protein BDZ89DRAFT_395083 [Hymenopellis radicata]|nr:hypothetical protein BDZ89DRAFT_395083 [Hymenopellis radicata]